MKLALLLLIPAGLAAQTVEGTVYDARTGMPLAGAIVSWGDTKAHTDTAGHFRLSPPSTAPPLDVERAGYLSALRIFPKDADTSALRINLVPAAAITGKLTDEDGLPVVASVAAMRYQLLNGRRKLISIAYAMSDDRGEYRLAGLHPGRYYIRAVSSVLAAWDRRYVRAYYPGTLQPSADGIVEVKTGEERGGANIRFSRCECATVLAHLDMADGVTEAQSRLHVHLEANEAGETYGPMTGPVDGTVRIPHVPPGKYILRTFFSGQQPKEGELFADQEVEIGDAGVQNIPIAVRPAKALDLSGTVIDEDGSQPPRMTIRAQRNLRGTVTAESNEEGGFKLEGLTPGHYSVTVMRAPGEEKRRRGRAVSIRLGDQEVLHVGFDLNDDSPPPLKITLTHRSFTVHGKLLDASGNPVPDGYVLLDPGKPGATISAHTLIDGTFRLDPLTAGEYHVYVADEAHSTAFLDPVYLAAHANDFAPVMVADGENPPLTLNWRRPSP